MAWRVPIWEALAPGRFEYERARMAEIGFVLDGQALARTGRAVFHGLLEHKRGQVSLTVIYPDTFPFLRPEVLAPQLDLGRHHNPYGGNLCLLDRSTRAWNPQDTGAWLVRERVPHLLDLLESGGERLRREEAPQGEPMSRYFVPAPGSAVLIPAALQDLPSEAVAGRARIAAGGNDEGGPRLRGCLARVTMRRDGKKHKHLASLEGPLARRFSEPFIDLTWVRLGQLPRTGNLAADLLEAARSEPGYEEPPAVPINGGAIRIVGVLVREEVRLSEWADTWLFIVRERRGRREGLYIVRGHRFGEEDLLARVPALSGMADARIGLIGLGALGGPLALELARAQAGELRLLDHDVVDAGTIVRWPRGVSAIGFPKTDVLAATIRSDYPYTKVRAVSLRIGGTPPPEVVQPQSEVVQPQSELEQLEGLLEGLDLVVDCTAEIGIQHLIASLAEAKRLPQVYVSATAGGWGGIIARPIPGATGCWFCMQLHLDGGGVSPPPADEDGRVQPAGCDNPTFTATSFDALSLVAQAMRVIATTVLSPRPTATQQDVFVCDQRPASPGEITAPKWSSYPLAVHPDCPLCRPPAG